MTSNVPLVALVLLVALVTALAVAARLPLAVAWRAARTGLRRRLRGGLSPERRRAAEADRRTLLRWVHELISRRVVRAIANALAAVTVATSLLAGAFAWLLDARATKVASAAFVTAFEGEVLVEPVPSNLADAIAAGAAAAALTAAVWMIARGAQGPLSQVLATVGDVAGFWRPTASPLGARGYRDAVVSEVREIVLAHGPRRVVLVGHSQGSVIAAWVAASLARDHADRGRLRGLVTCGSPLRSLFATLFPTLISDTVLTRAVDASEGWVNCWRGTDPIGTPLAHVGVDDIELEDPAPGQDTASGHSDYWDDPVQATAIAAMIGPGPS